jgi:hypothetical protein
LNADAKSVWQVPVVKLPDPEGFPGLYVGSVIAHPWLLDGSTLLMSSHWRSSQVILAVNVERYVDSMLSACNLAGQLRCSLSSEQSCSCAVAQLQGLHPLLMLPGRYLECKTITL